MVIKTKSLCSIMINGMRISIKLAFNLKSNHITISSAFSYPKGYYEKNRDPNTARQNSLEDKIKKSCAQQGINREDFNGFTNEQKYCPKFNESCRESNREKYNNECFICSKSENNNGRKLSVHHIDMSKSQGCDGEKWKLVPVCLTCHNKIHNDLWESRIKYLLGEI